MSKPTRSSSFLMEIRDPHLQLKQILTGATHGHRTAEVCSHSWEFYIMPLPTTLEGLPAGSTGIALNVTQRHHTDGEVRWRNREITALNYRRP